jgi:hypothetical protein
MMPATFPNGILTSCGCDLKPPSIGASDEFTRLMDLFKVRPASVDPPAPPSASDSGAGEDEIDEVYAEVLHRLRQRARRRQPSIVNIAGTLCAVVPVLMLWREAGSSTTQRIISHSDDQL